MSAFHSESLEEADDLIVDDFHAIFIHSSKQPGKLFKCSYQGWSFFFFNIYSYLFGCARS